jgi:hypothetical protein
MSSTPDRNQTTEAVIDLLAAVGARPNCIWVLAVSRVAA